MSNSRQYPLQRGRGRPPPTEPGPRTHSRQGTMSCPPPTTPKPLNKPSFEHDLESNSNKGLESQVQQLREADKELGKRTAELEEDIKRMKQKLRDRENQREQLKEITKELAVAQRFLSTADSLSQAEVIRAMEALNEEIFQLTSIVADKVQVEEKKLLNEAVQTAVLERSPWIQGLGALLDVIMPKTLMDTLAIQIGWQSILVQCCFQIIRAWMIEDLGYGGEVNSDLETMYLGILSENDHAVAGRWRSMVHGVTNEISSETRGMIIGPVLNSLADLPYLCGYIRNREGYNDIYDAFEQRIEPFLDRCLKFRKMIGEEITSTDIRPYFFGSGERYNPGLHAELEYEDEKGEAPKGIIACSLSLGLYSVGNPQNRDGDAEDREPILKPKVVLQDTLKEIIS